MGPLRITRADGSNAGVGNLFSRLSESETVNPSLPDSAYRLLGAIILDCVKNKAPHSYGTNAHLGSLAGGKCERWSRHWLRKLEALGIVTVEQDRTKTNAPRRITPLCSYRPSKSASNRHEPAGEEGASNRHVPAGRAAQPDRVPGTFLPVGRQTPAGTYRKREKERKIRILEMPSASDEPRKGAPPTPAEVQTEDPACLAAAMEALRSLPGVAAARAARLATARGRAPGSSAKTPPGPNSEKTIPDAKHCTVQPGESSRSERQTEHTDH